MNENKKTRTFPPGKSKGHDPARLKTLLKKAFVAYKSSLENQQLSKFKREIFRLREGRIASQEVDFPQYWFWDPKSAREALLHPDIRHLFDYAWNRGELRKTLTGPDPKRESWELFVLYEVIHTPLTRILEETAIDEASDTGKVTLWRLPTECLELAVNETVGRILHSEHTYLAKCPLAWMRRSSGSTWPIVDGVALKILTPEERVRYLSRHHNKILWHETLSGFSGLSWKDVAVLEIVGRIDVGELRRGRPPRTGNDIVEQEIADTVDIVKWALMLCANHSTPLIEGTITYQDVLGGSLSPVGFVGAFRRQQANQGTVYDLDAIDMPRVAALFQKARDASRAYADVKQAFWYWGRSSVAALERDALLDSVIGLESLLVPHPGELRYRFGLHGAALLAESQERAEEVAKELRNLYDKRSSAAHGKKEEPVRQASIALTYLSKAIRAVIELANAGMIDPSKPVAEQVEKLILRGSPLRIKDELPS